MYSYARSHRDVASPARSKYMISLPGPSYRYLKDILNESCRPGTMVNVMGLVKDYRAPVPTKGKDYKAQLILADLSNDSDYGGGVKLNIFRPPAQIPTDINAGDVVVVLQAKVQNYGSENSLLTSRRTDVLVFDKRKIPTFPVSAKVALQAPVKKQSHVVSDKEFQYVTWLYRQADKNDIPDDHDFSERKGFSSNLREKYCLLKDVQADTFHDMVVQLVKSPHDLGDKITIWVSDYTENGNFFRYNPTAGDLPGRDGDQFGYTSNMADEPVHSKWKGPPGKFSMQITCYEPHATFFRDEEIILGDWVTLKNVNINFGKNGGNIEGFLREDRLYKGRMQVTVLNADDQSDHRLKNAIERKEDLKLGLKNMTRNNVTMQPNGKDRAVGVKRKKRAAEEESPPAKRNAKTKRRLERALKYEKDAAEKARELGLNPEIRCRHPEEPITPIPDILKPAIYRTFINKIETHIPLPFTNAKYRTVGRVVDFWPRNIAMFAKSPKATEGGGRSFNEMDIGSSDDDDSLETTSQSRGQQNWEWRFALQLEDTYPTKKVRPDRKRFWVVVDNFAGQYLLGMDAVDLSQNPNALQQLRCRLFTLWGELEKCKSAVDKSAIQQKGLNLNLRHAPPDSPDMGPEISSPALDPGATVSSLPFPCCIQQHGVSVDANKGEEAHTPTGEKWERVFTLFGVKIML